MYNLVDFLKKLQKKNVRDNITENKAVHEQTVRQTRQSGLCACGSGWVPQEWLHSSIRRPILVL